jgi:transposase
MNAIVEECVAFAPTNLNKVQLAKWIKSKWRTLNWEEAHYHALHAVLVRVESRIKEMFVSFLDEEPDEEALRELFDRSLSERYDYVCDWLDVPKSKETFEELILSDI